MYVKKYRYSVHKKDGDRIKNLEYYGASIYKEHGAIHCTAEFIEEKNTIWVISQEHYHSEEHCTEVKHKVQKDPRHKALWEEFCSMVNQDEIVEDTEEDI